MVVREAEEGKGMAWEMGAAGEMALVVGVAGVAGARALVVGAAEEMAWVAGAAGERAVQAVMR